jgi:hypothetical protein
MTVPQETAPLKRSALDAVLITLLVGCVLCVALFLVPLGIRPILLSLLVGLVFFKILKKKNNGAFPVEIGSFYFAVVFLYCTMPFVGFALNGFEYRIFSDSRLYEANPSPEEVVHVGYYYVLYLTIFAATYLTLRASGSNSSCDRVRPPSLSIVLLLIMGYLLLVLPMLYLKYTAMGWSFQDYLQHYLWVYEYPLVVRQILNHVSSITIVLEIFIITYLFMMYPRGRVIIIALLLVQFVSLMLILGARKEFTLLVAAAVICYYNYVRPFSIVKATLVGTAFIVVFLFIGWGRNFHHIPWELLGSFFPSTEFEAIFGNAFDIYSRKISGSIHPPDLYLFEGILNFVPQQLIPFEKPSLSRWYVETFYSTHAEAGRAFAFGVIAEALLSDVAWLAVSWRAAFHGLLLAMVFNLLNRDCSRPIQAGAYVSLTVLSYHLFRDTTFSLLPKVFLDLMPVVALVYLLPVMARPSGRVKGR